MAFECINADQAMGMIRDENAVVVDIRDQQSFSNGHIDGAVHLDNSTVEAFITQADPELPLIVCCYHGNMKRPQCCLLISLPLPQMSEMRVATEATKAWV